MNSLGKYTICTETERKQFEKEYINILNESKKEFDTKEYKYIIIAKYDNHNNFLRIIENNGYYGNVVLDKQFRKENPNVEYKTRVKYRCYLTENGYMVKCELIQKSKNV